ncbi:Aste57867_8421 [Aphanomyces stellatus]|uniref:Aste57867_8421 protein n=1 Tax=Aphanomyces stellatus TaxID=120398 RepID=A0A485KKE0_9STRA|nr:hypothetical protein As57867_008389 [Aphanomyces stellatus]VFT85307.1 Aste57867_8421 [Aphanomyces stellatus]
MTVDEEIQARGGLALGYTTCYVVPKVGRAVVFSQHVLHEALHAKTTTSSNNLARFVLRTDVMATRPPQPYAVPPSERPSYNLVLEYFRRAQQHELEGELDAAGDLYERCLSIRYRFPATNDEPEVTTTTTRLDGVPSHVLELVGHFLDAASLYALVCAFPAMQWLQVATSAWAKGLVEALAQDATFDAPAHAKMMSLDNLSRIVASSTQVNGTALWTTMHASSFFDAHVEGCCRVAALKTFFALGHTIQEDVDDLPAYYCINFDPETRATTLVRRNHVLTAAFYNLPCFGSIFTVESYQEDVFVSDDEYSDNDDMMDAIFQDSVDRRYMMAAYGIDDVGRDIVGATAEYYHATVLDDDKTELSAHGVGKLAAEYAETRTVAFGTKRKARAAKLPLAKRALLPHATTFQGLKTSKLVGPRSDDSGSDSDEEEFVYMTPRGINRLVFDFTRTTLAVEEVASNDDAYKTCRGTCPEFSWANTIDRRFPNVERVRHFIVHVGVVADAPAAGGYSHASAEMMTISEEINVHHIHLDHVHLRVLYAANGNVYLISTYGGIAAL